MKEQTGIKRVCDFDEENKSYLNKKPCLNDIQRYRSEVTLHSLSDESFDKLLTYIPINDLGRLSLVSKETGKRVLAYLVSDAFSHRAANLIADDSTDEQFDTECEEIARALKRATFLYPVIFRLNVFHQFTDKLRWCIKDFTNECCEDSPSSLNAVKCIGILLQVFIAGWDEDECFKVFGFISRKYSLSEALTRFVGDEPGKDLINERFLRCHLRYLFLDQCPSNAERAVWIGFISHHLGTAQLAKLILLLYGPLDEQDQVIWTFALHTRAFELYTGAFIKLGKIIGLLQLIPYWSKRLSLEVLVYMSNVPNCWLLRSFASILLPLNYYDKELVLEYFSVLYKSGRASTAALLMSLVLMISPHYINHSNRILSDHDYELMSDEENEIDCFIYQFLHDEKCAYKFISNIINSHRMTDQRYYIVDKLWQTVSELAADFAEAAIQDVFDEDEQAFQSEIDYQYLMEAWTSYMITAMND